ncbi:hypothetical protein P4S83_11890 [Aneurinibacillus thermoaerophilus]|jgi:A/G-specific adenine glycosylase|uniref:hypothetical protein n=1 Tax=Aneurinibacillus thermoaerophilus TaxID=143495 RepID=UPI002E24DD63|nr:hypothetical protein [Aneurinibacillus thermoaerophilus]MED0763344.1 hypothetical protein [Aneurinibacillus thermoaerophilus]
MELKILPETIEYFTKGIIDWGRKNYDDFPWRESKNKWHSLVAEIMLQRTKAEQVVSAYEEFCAKYPTPLDYLKDEEANVFATLGLYWREERLKDLAKVLSKTEVPEDKGALLKLPGIGDYIAAAYRSLHWGTRDVIIDSNVVRIYGRFFGFKTDPETRRKKWFKDLANEITPEDNFKDFNYGLIDFTRKVCKPKPRCKTCELRMQCKYG